MRSRLIRLDACEIDLERRVVRRDDGELTLTWQEGELLAYLAARPGEPITREELLREVWERPGRAPPTRAVDIAVRRLREKIERVPERPRHLVTQRGSGYRLELAVPGREPARIGGVGRVPAERGRFLGRAAEASAAEAALARARAVALVGPPGVGKTRLAVHLARAWQEAGRAVWFVDLHAVPDAAGAVSAVAETLGLPPDEGPATGRLDRLARTLRGHGPLVLVLDHLDGVRDPGPLLEGLRHVPELALLVTTRTALPADGLHRVDVAPLPEADGVALLLDRARALRAGWGDGADDVVRRIVAGLDGLPLALELAAARASVLSPSMVLQGLEDRFRMLTGETTLYGALDWSWSLLSPLEQASAAQLSVFRGGFTLEAAAAVVSHPAPAPWVLDWLQPLVDRSLVHATALPSGGMRFAMFESQRVFARGRLAPADAAEVEARHRATFTTLAEELPGRLRGPDGEAARPELAAELENLRTAHHGALGRDPHAVVATALALDALLEQQAPTSERLALLERAVSAAATASDQARTRLARGAVQAVRGADDEGLADVDEALALAAALGDPRLLAGIQDVRAELLVHRQDHAGARHAAGEALRLATACGDRVLQALAHLKLGHLAALGGDLPSAERHFRTMRALAADTRSWRLQVRARSNIALLARLEGRLADAERDYVAALVIARAAGDALLEATLLDNLGAVHAGRGDTDAALRCFAEALALHRRVGSRRGEVRALGNRGILLVGAGRLEEGRQGLREALDLAEVDDDPRHVGRLHGNLGVCLAQLGETDGARRHLEEALRVLDGRPPFAAAYFSAHLGVAAADLDDADAAALALARAEAGLDAAQPMVRGLLRVVAAHVALARARRGEPEGRAAAVALKAEAEALAGSAAPGAGPGTVLETILPSEVTAAIRNLERTLART